MIGIPFNQGNVCAGSVWSQQLLWLASGGGMRVNPSCDPSLTGGVKLRHSPFGVNPQVEPGAVSPVRLELPVGSMAMIATTFPGFACGISQLNGPVIECVMMIAGPILSIRWLVGFGGTE